MEDSVKIKVKNRASYPVVYFVPDMNNMRREFSPHEEKVLTFQELRKLSGVKGGLQLLKEELIIKDDQALEELGIHTEPEYFYEKDDVIKILKEGSMDEFLDCLDFAPAGVIDLIKEQAVSLPLNDIAKRDVLLEKFDFDVNKIIEIRKITKEGQETEEKVSNRRRAAAPISAQTSQKERRTGARINVNK